LVRLAQTTSFRIKCKLSQLLQPLLKGREGPGGGG
jgi:hypothetical protein